MSDAVSSSGHGDREQKVQHLAKKLKIPREEAGILLENMVANDAE